MKRIAMVAAAASAALTLAACGQSAGDKVEEAYNDKAEVLETKADAQAAAGAPAMAASTEARASAAAAKGEVMGNAVDDGTLSAAQAAPSAPGVPVASSSAAAAH